MNKKIFSCILVIAMLGLFYGTSYADKNVSITSGIEEAQVYMGRTFHFKITISWKGDWADLNVSYPDRPEGLKLDVVGSTSSVTSKSTPEGTETIREMVFEVVPLEEGRGMISALTVVIKDNATDEETSLETNPVNIEIKPAPFSLFTAIGNFASSKYATPVGAGMIAIVVIILVIGYLRKSGSATMLEEDLDISPREAFFNEMDEAENIRISGDLKAYFDAIEKAIRFYAAERWEIPVGGGWDNFMGKLEKTGVEGELVTRLEAFYELAKKVKFAGEVPDAETIDKIRYALRTAL